MKSKSFSRALLIVMLAVVLVLLIWLFLRNRSKSFEPVDEVVVHASGGWLELPELAHGVEGQHVITHRAQMDGRSQRNYTILYDEDLYAALWVAYPLCDDHISSGREETWAYDPQLPESVQTSVRRGYGASVPTINYPQNFYARGHQIPNADRSAVPQMQAQTYFSTNMTPQIQNGFNGAVWARLEEAVRSVVPAADTLYVVTGASFTRPGSNDRVQTIVNKNDSKSIPVPNYYWKALLKVRRSDKGITGASTIGFWLRHDDLKGESYDDYVVSVDQIEKWTGLDLFPNLPDSMESVAERQESWQVFRSF